MKLIDFGDSGGVVMDTRTKAIIDLQEKMWCNPAGWIAINVVDMVPTETRDIMVTFRYAGADSVWDNKLISQQVMQYLEVGGWYVIRIEWVQKGRKRYKKWQTLYMAGEREVVEELGKACADWHRTLKHK